MPDDHNMKMYAAQLVLQVLFGGGSSFSSGGPGKGLHSIFYSDGLNRHYWLSHLSAGIARASCCKGMFLIHGACEPDYLANLSRMMGIECLGRVCRPSLRHSELNRALKQLRLNLSLKLEQVPMLMEQIAFDWLHYGHWVDPDTLYRALDMVSVDDVECVARQIIQSPMAVVAMGKLAKMPDVEELFRFQKDLFI